MSKARRTFVNGLPNLYEALKSTGQEEKGKELIENFLKLTFAEDISEKVERFRNTGIPPIRADLKYFPIYSELVQAYTNGLFYSTVMLAGTLCERICFDILSMQKVQVNGQDLTEDQISHLYEKDFNRVNRLLYAWGLIEKDTHDEMFEIYGKRIQYVHPKMKNIDPKRDSLDMLKKVTKVLVEEFVKKPTR
jgi:hypothetical protein